MRRVWRLPLSALLAVGLVTGAVALPGIPGMALAVSAPRLTPGSPPSDITPAPVRPPECTAEQIAAVDLDHCALMVDGTPATHGFPLPPFPGNQFITTPITAEEWQPLARGARGPIVTLLQVELQKTVTDLPVDGKFGQATEDAVKRVQREVLTLPETGIVDAVMAEQLGILVNAVQGDFPPEGWVWNGNSWSGSPALAAWEARMVKTTVKVDPIAAGLFEGFLADIKSGNYRVDQAGTYSFRCTATTTRNCKGITTSSLSYHAWGLAVDLNYTMNPLQTVHSSTDACARSEEHTSELQSH